MTDFGRRIALHSATHEDAGTDEIEATDLEGRVNYVDRGDPSGYDFASGSFTKDGEWHDLDLSSIVPAGERLVYIRVNFYDNLVNSYAWFKPKANSNTINSSARRIQAANLAQDMMFFIVCDANGIIQYNFTNTTYNFINFTVLGWFT